MINVLVISHTGVLFEGQASRVILPGEAGVFEVLPFHRPLVSRLFPGTVIVDETLLPITRGVVTVNHNRVTALVEGRGMP